MKKIIVSCICFLILFCSCSKKSIVTGNNDTKTEESKKEDIIRIEPESKIIQVNPWKNDLLTLTLKYKTSGIFHYNNFDDKYEALLEEVLYYYEDGNEEHYLGKVDRTGVYDREGKCLFLTSESYVKEGYVHDIILEAPSHIEYFWFEYDEKYVSKYPGEIHVTFEPVVLLSFDLENMTIKKFIPNI